MTAPRRLDFGIYPLSVAGTPEGLAVGPPDDFDRVRAALRDLGRSVVSRTYLVDTSLGGEAAILTLADRYRDAGLLGHAVLGCMRDADFELERWVELVRTVVRTYGDTLSSLQITNEPNLSFMDGSKPYTLDALVHGVMAANDVVRELGLSVEVGFGSVPQTDVAVPGFWTDLAAVGGPEFVDAIDFVGHNFFVDVFEESVDLADVPARVEQVVRDLRFRDLTAAGIPESVPIRVTENGWPTGTNPFSNAARTCERQAAVLDTVIRTIHRLADETNVTHYMLFGLRDADTSKPDLFHQFGIVRDDYSPKPAYWTYKAVIDELGAAIGTSL